MAETWTTEADDVDITVGPAHLGPHLICLSLDMTECATKHGDPQRAWGNLTPADALRLARELTAQVHRCASRHVVGA